MVHAPFYRTCEFSCYNENGLCTNLNFHWQQWPVGGRQLVWHGTSNIQKDWQMIIISRSCCYDTIASQFAWMNSVTAWNLSKSATYEIWSWHFSVLLEIGWGIKFQSEESSIRRPFGTYLPVVLCVLNLGTPASAIIHVAHIHKNPTLLISCIDKLQTPVFSWS